MRTIGCGVNATRRGSGCTGSGDSAHTGGCRSGVAVGGGAHVNAPASIAFFFIPTEVEIAMARACDDKDRWVSHDRLKRVYGEEDPPAATLLDRDYFPFKQVGNTTYYRGYPWSEV